MKIKSLAKALNFLLSQGADKCYITTDTGFFGGQRTVLSATVGKEEFVIELNKEDAKLRHITEKTL